MIGMSVSLRFEPDGRNPLFGRFVVSTKNLINSAKNIALSRQKLKIMFELNQQSELRRFFRNGIKLAFYLVTRILPIIIGAVSATCQLLNSLYQRKVENEWTPRRASHQFNEMRYQFKTFGGIVRGFPCGLY